jgi:hypothetical protein
MHTSGEANTFHESGWEDTKEGVQEIVSFHGTDDNLIPVAEARHIAKKLDGDIFINQEMDGKSHFFQPWKELLDIFD